MSNFIGRCFLGYVNNNFYVGEYYKTTYYGSGENEQYEKTILKNCLVLVEEDMIIDMANPIPFGLKDKEKKVYLPSIPVESFIYCVEINNNSDEGVELLTVYNNKIELLLNEDLAKKIESILNNNLEKKDETDDN